MTFISSQNTTAPDAIIEAETHPEQACILHPADDANPCPIVFASPHSGRAYPAGFMALCAMPLIQMRRVEDAYIDKLLDPIPAIGAALICARRTRCYIDVNRYAGDYDAALFKPLAPNLAAIHAKHTAPPPDEAKAHFGLGCLPRIAYARQPIYHGRIAASEHESRLQSSWYPYHEQLKQLLKRAHQQCQFCVLIDCHSMPSSVRVSGGKPLPDIVLGDRHGQSCSPAISDFWEKQLHKAGFSTARNVPYAGGYCTAHYGRPDQREHALQIEIRRDLYLDEAQIVLNAGFPALQSVFSQIAKRFIDWSRTNASRL